MSDYRSPDIEQLATELHDRIERLARYQSAIKLLRLVMSATDTALGYKDGTGRW